MWHADKHEQSQFVISINHQSWIMSVLSLLCSAAKPSRYLYICLGFALFPSTLLAVTKFSNFYLSSLHAQYTMTMSNFSIQCTIFISFLEDCFIRFFVSKLYSFHFPQKPHFHWIKCLSAHLLISNFSLPAPTIMGSNMLKRISDEINLIMTQKLQCRVL